MQQPSTFTNPPVVVPDTEVLDDEEVRKKIIACVPIGKRSYITEEFIQRLQNISSDETFRESLIRNFENYGSMIEEGNHNPVLYMQVITYASFITWGYSREKAFAKAKPDVYQKMLAKGLSDKDIQSRICSFEGGELAVKVLQQLHTPVAIYHRSKYEKAINILNDMMIDESTPARERLGAASKLVDTLEMPKDAKQHLFGIIESKDTSLTAIQKSLDQLVKGQRKEVKDGNMTTTDAAGRTLVMREDEDGVFRSPATEDDD